MTTKGRERGTGWIIALQRQGESYAFVRGEAGATEVAEAVTLSWDEVRSRLTALAAERKGIEGRVVRVLAGSRTICRVMPVPAGGASELGSASRLLGEAQLPEGTPAYRMGCGVFPESVADIAASENRAALLTAWRSDPAKDEPALDVEGVEETWTTVPAALGYLAKASGSAGPVWYADGLDGTIAVVQGAGDATMARVVVEDNTSAGSWREAVEATVGDGSGEVTLTPTVSIPGVRPAGVGAWREEADWQNRYAVAVGALQLASTGNEASRGLAEIRREPRKVREPALVRAAGAMSRPRAAWVVVAASVVLLVGAPLGLAWARLSVLDAKAKGLDKQKDRRKELDRRSAVYQQLELERWPMTKLLADLSQATPEGVVVTNLRLSPDQSGGATSERALSIQGTAKTREQVNNLVSSLNKTEVFSGARALRADSKADAVEFDIAAGVTNPHAPAKIVLEKPDWAAEPLAKRLYGEKGSNLTPPAGSESEDRSTRRSARAMEEEESGDRRGSRSTPAAETTKPGEVPKPLADDEISTMDRSRAMREMVSRRAYSQKNPSLDQASKRRLEDEVAKLRARIDVLNRAGGTAGGKGAP